VPGEQPKIDGLVKLNTNECPYGPSEKVLAAIAGQNSEALRLYPDPQASALKAAIARRHGLAENQVFVGNGSDEVLAHIFMGLLRHEAPLLFPDISYSFYPVYAKLYGIATRAIPLAEGLLAAGGRLPAGGAERRHHLRQPQRAHRHAAAAGRDPPPAAGQPRFGGGGGRGLCGLRCRIGRGPDRRIPAAAGGPHPVQVAPWPACGWAMRWGMPT
jgi:hypothetical protein